MCDNKTQHILNPGDCFSVTPLPKTNLCGIIGDTIYVDDGMRKDKYDTYTREFVRIMDNGMYHFDPLIDQCPDDGCEKEHVLELLYLKRGKEFTDYMTRENVVILRREEYHHRINIFDIRELTDYHSNKMIKKKIKDKFKKNASGYRVSWGYNGAKYVMYHLIGSMQDGHFIYDGYYIMVRDNQIVTMLYDDGSLQFGDSDTYVLLVNDKNIIVWNSGDVWSTVLFKYNETPDGIREMTENMKSISLQEIDV